MKETIAHEYSPYKDVSDEDIEARILELKRKLGWPESASKYYQTNMQSLALAA